MAKRRNSSPERTALKREVSGLLRSYRIRQENVKKAVSRHSGYAKKQVTSPAYRSKTAKYINRASKGDLKSMTTAKLERLRDALLEVRQMSTSTVQGAVRYEEVIERKTRFLDLNDDELTILRNLWDDLIDKGGIYLIYKYEVYDLLVAKYVDEGLARYNDKIVIRKKLTDMVDPILNDWYKQDQGFVEENATEMKYDERTDNKPLTPEERVEHAKQYESPEAQRRRMKHMGGVPETDRKKTTTKKKSSAKKR